MRPPNLPPDEYDEIVYVRSLCANFLRNANDIFNERYPGGAPFIPRPEDYAVLDMVEGLAREKITLNREAYPAWTDEDIGGLATMVRMSLMMRFKRVERDTKKIPDLSMLVEGIIEAEKEPSVSETPANVVRLPKRPHLRLVRTPLEADTE